MTKKHKHIILRKNVYSTLKISEPTDNNRKLIESLLVIGTVDNIVKIFRLFPDEKRLPVSKVTEVLTRWYPTEDIRARNLPESCRKHFFNDEWTRTQANALASGKTTKKNTNPPSATPRFVPMTSGFKPQRPYRPSVIEGRQVFHRQQAAQEKANTSTITSQTNIFTAHFIKLMKEKIPAAQQVDFRKYVLKNRISEMSEEQLIQNWIFKNTAKTTTASKNSLALGKVLSVTDMQSELRTNQTALPISTPKSELMKLTATGSERIVYQRDLAAQASFRRRLFDLWNGKCAIEMVALAGVLEAAHILHGEDFSDDNGILMTPTMHALFDRHLIGIEPETLIVHVSPLLPNLFHHNGFQLTAPVELNKAGLAIRWKEYLRAIKQDH